MLTSAGADDRPVRSTGDEDRVRNAPRMSDGRAIAPRDIAPHVLTSARSTARRRTLAISSPSRIRHLADGPRLPRRVGERQVALDILVYEAPSLGPPCRTPQSASRGGIHTFENDTGPDEANHDWHGIFILSTAGAAAPLRGQLPDVSIYDIAPTLLRLMGQPVPTRSPAGRSTDAHGRGRHPDGFLGSGKTTLLRYVLEHGLRGKPVAVIMNEIGEVGIDARW